MVGNKILFMLMIISLSLILPASGFQYDAAGKISTITNYPEERWEIEICEDNVIWIEPGNGYGGQAIYLYNIPDQETLKVASSKYTTYHPHIAGNMIFWGNKAESAGPVQLVGYDIINRNFSFIDPYPSNQDFPSSGDGATVWLDSRTGGYTNIYMVKDGNDESAVFHKSKTSDKHNPEISGGYVYWVEKGALYRKNIEFDILEAIITDVPNEFSISGSLAVWEYDNNGQKDIALLDTTLMYAETIVEKPGDQTSPDIDEKNIVWQEYENGVYSIRIKNTDTGINAKIWSSGYLQSDPKISGRKVIWLDKTPGSEGIIMFSMDKEVKPSADFTSDAKPSLPPLTVHFVPEIVTPVDIKPEMRWDFGDGAFSTETEPAHTYTKPGIYNVTLTVYNEFGADIIFKPSLIVVGELPVPDFYSDKTSGTIPLTIRFKDDSSGSYDTRMWDFGDGIGSILKNPIHTYDTTGFYTVSLTLSNEYGSVTEEKFAYINTVSENVEIQEALKDTEKPDLTKILSLNSAGDPQPGSVILLFDIQGTIEFLNSK